MVKPSRGVLGVCEGCVLHKVQLLVVGLLRNRERRLRFVGGVCATDGWMDEWQELGSVVPGRVVGEVGLNPVGREVELTFRIDSGFGSNSLPAQEILFWNPCRQ